MRTLCDVCENAAAILFCAADEAALCRACDDKVHMCNKLASRHVRVGLAEPSALQRCDICENAPAFFYCDIDGTSLCLQCDMIVHVGGKRTHGRYLLLRQRIEFPGDNDNPGLQRSNLIRTKENNHNNRGSPIRISSDDNNGNMENNMIDLNARPQRMHEQAENNQGPLNDMAHNSHKSESVVPNGYYKRDAEK